MRRALYVALGGKIERTLQTCSQQAGAVEAPRPRSPIHRALNPNPMDLLRFDGEETVDVLIELDAAIIGAAPLSHCHRLR